NNVDTAITGSVVLSLGSNPGAATLAGGEAVAFNKGVADFPQVLIDRGGTGYTIRAEATPGGLPVATSVAFTVSPISLVLVMKQTLGSEPRGILVNGSSVYFTNNTELWKVPRVGGTPALLDDFSSVPGHGPGIMQSGRLV